jgi:hypothetical protein
VRELDLIDDIKWKGHNVTSSAWVNHTDLPFDGDCELETDVEGWDIIVRVELMFEEQRYSGEASLSSCWGNAEHIRQQAKEVEKLAIEDMIASIMCIAQGSEVKAAQEHQKWAATIIKLALLD